MMNDAMFRQSQRAIEHTEATMKLALLAFLFAPLSFTTSVFFMHFTEINDKDHQYLVVVSGVYCAP